MTLHLNEKYINRNICNLEYWGKRRYVAYPTKIISFPLTTLSKKWAAHFHIIMPHFQKTSCQRWHLSNICIPIIQIRWPHDHIIFSAGIPICGQTLLYQSRHPFYWYKKDTDMELMSQICWRQVSSGSQLWKLLMVGCICLNGWDIPDISCTINEQHYQKMPPRGPFH